MTDRRAAAACTGGWASMSAGKRLSSAICRIGPGCSAGQAEVSSGTVADEAVDKTAFAPGAVATIGTPDDLVARIKSVHEISGGAGTVVGFVHDWANPENTMRSWDMVARYVVPEINGYLAGLRQSAHFVATNRGVFNRAQQAIMAKIQETEAAVAALAVTRGSRLGDVASASNVPDLDKARSQARAR